MEPELSIKQKSVIMKACIYSIIILNFVVLLGFYALLTQQDISNQQYLPTFNQYASHYLSQQSKFQRFSFYENYDQLVLNNHELNQNYRKGVDELWNYNVTVFYEVYKIIREIALIKKYSEILKLQFDYYDWSNEDVKVKDMKFFQVSHIFSVLTSIEYYINENKTNEQQWISLSAQQIIDCCQDCLQKQAINDQGQTVMVRVNSPNPVYQYIKKNGVTLQQNYPYENSIRDQNKRECRRNETNKVYKIKGYRQIKKCTGLVSDIIHGPVVVGVDARNWQSYFYGVFSSCQREATHYAVLVGLSPEYWKVQNSWGTKWGEKGYIRLASKDTCGICLSASVPRFY